MNLTETLFAILIPTFVILMTLLFWWKIWSNSSGNDVSRKGINFFRLDVRNRKIQLIRNKSKSTIFKGIKNGKWVLVKALLNHFFDKENVEKKFRELFLKLDKDQGVDEKMEFISKVMLHSKKTPYLITINFSPLEDDSNYIMQLSWQSVEEKSEQQTEIDFSSKGDIINSPSPYKAFITFNLNQSTYRPDNELAQLLIKYVNKDVTIVIHNDLLIVVFFGKTIKRTRKHIEKFIYRTKTKAFKYGARTFFRGSAYTIKKDVNTNVKFLSVIKALNFFIALSIEKGIDFLTSDTEKKAYTQEDFTKFSKSSKVFRASTKSGQLDTQYISVRSKKTNRKVIDFAFPNIKGISDKMFSTLLINRNNRNELINSHAKKVAIEGRIKKPILLDVNSDWLIKNEKKIVFKKAIYVINLKEGTGQSEIIGVVQRLGERGFYFAIRIQNFSESKITYVKKIKPQFILIDKSVWGESELGDSQTMIWLMTIRKISKAENIKVIYENPSNVIDEVMAKKIGMNFVYNF